MFNLTNLPPLPQQTCWSNLTLMKLIPRPGTHPLQAAWGGGGVGNIERMNDGFSFPSNGHHTWEIGQSTLYEESERVPTTTCVSLPTN